MNADSSSAGPSSESQKMTLRLPEEQVKQTDALVEFGEFPNRSEVIRAALRQLLFERDAREKLEEQQRVRNGEKK